MIISDIDYLEPIPETYATHLNGGSAVAISEFLADAYSDSANVSTVIKNVAINGYFATSSVRVTSIASGDNIFVSSSASAISSASSQV